MSDTNQDEDFYVSRVSTFFLKVQSLTKEANKKHSLPSIPRIKQIQASWKGKIYILKSLKETTTLLEDRKNTIFFKVDNSITELKGPTLIKHSTLITPNEKEIGFSKLKDKWV